MPSEFDFKNKLLHLETKLKAVKRASQMLEGSVDEILTEISSEYDEKIPNGLSNLLNKVMSSDIKVAPESINLRARSDLPEPDSPKIATPLSSIATLVAWSLFDLIFYPINFL